MLRVLAAVLLSIGAAALLLVTDRVLGIRGSEEKPEDSGGKRKKFSTKRRGHVEK